MGRYTDHWARHRQQSLRHTLRAVWMVGLGVPAIAFTGYVLSPMDNLRTGVLVAVIIGWLWIFTVLVMRGARVDCPRCDTRYSRGKYLVNCPGCGLRMLQEDP